MRVSVTRFTTSTARHGVQRAVCVPSMSLRKAASSLAGPISQRLGFGSVSPLFSSPACSTSVTRRVSTTVFAISEGRQEGTVKWFNATKGFGFIVPSDGGADIFVHQTSIQADGFRSLAEGETVEFEIGSDNNGRPRAINVTGPAGAQPVGAPRQSFAGGPGGGGGRGGRDDYGGGYNDQY